MKRIFLLIAVVLGFAATKVNAQQQPVRFGIKAGLNLAQWEGETVGTAEDIMNNFTDGAISREMRTGFHAGGYVSIPVLPGFEIEPGLQYSQRGTKLVGRVSYKDSDILSAKVTAINKAEYIDLPVLAKVYVGEGFHIFGGPQFSYLVSNKVNVDGGALGISIVNRDFDVTDKFREFDVALTGGLGYKFVNGFNLSAGYDYGLNSVDKNGSFDAFNRTIKASVGYTF